MPVIKPPIPNPLAIKPAVEEINEAALIEEVLQDAEMDYYGPLVLHTPFHGEEAFCYIVTRTRRYRLSDLFKQSEDLYGILPVLLTEKELLMLYVLLYPKQDPDMDAVNNILTNQSEALEKAFQKIIQ